jgi:hypothetical protein
MNKLKKIQYNCHKATFLIEKRSMKPLTLFEQVELRIHLAGCSVCRTYQRQSVLIGQMVHQLLHGNTVRPGLNDEDKQHMAERIEEELNK